MPDDEESIYGSVPDSQTGPATTPASPVSEPGFQMAETTPQAVPTPAPGPRRRGLWIGLGAAVAVVVVLLLIWAAGVGPFGHAILSPPPTVTIKASTLSFSPSSNPCFPSDYGTTTPGTLRAGGTFYFLAKLSNEASGAARFCTVESINVATPGFTLLSANVPLLVPASSTPTLNISVMVPSTAYVGDLNFTATTSYVLPNVTVKNTNVYFSPSNDTGPCGISGAAGSGFTSFTNWLVNGSVGFFVISPRDACTVTSVTTNTTGFAITSAGVPYQLPIDSFGGVSYVIRTPSYEYDGNVSVILYLAT